MSGLCGRARPARPYPGERKQVESPADTQAGVQAGTRVARSQWGPCVLGWEVQRSQGTDRRLLSDLAVLVEGGISASCSYC